MHRAMKFAFLGSVIAIAITTAMDAIEFMIAGAAAVGVGTALFYDPLVCQKINSGMLEYVERHGMGSVSELTGSLQC